MKKKGDKGSIKKEETFKSSTNLLKAEENKNTEKVVFKEISNVILI